MNRRKWNRIHTLKRSYRLTRAANLKNSENSLRNEENAENEMENVKSCENLSVLISFVISELVMSVF
jgi:hypothetical protein